MLLLVTFKVMYLDVSHYRYIVPSLQITYQTGLDAKWGTYGPRPVKIPENSFGPVKIDQ